MEELAKPNMETELLTIEKTYENYNHKLKWDGTFLKSEKGRSRHFDNNWHSCIVGVRFAPGADDHPLNEIPPYV